VFGGLSTYMNKGDWQLTIGVRGYRSNKHYRGTEPAPELDGNGPFNRQTQINFDIAYALTRKWNISVNVPVHFNSFEVKRPVPGTPDRLWQNTESSGIGDISVRARYWIFSTEQDKHNLAISAGVKLPTGKADRTDEVLGRTVPVDISIQTGDKSWAGTTGVQGFQRIKRLTVYGAASYLFNPRNTTGVRSFFASLTAPNTTTLNSATDQYSTQIGASVRVKQKWPVPSIGYRLEGVPVSDVFGASDGFRRPGNFGFVEPGLNMAVGKQLFSVGVAIRTYANVKDVPGSPRVEDATIPKYMFFGAYSVRF
jgi:hypothetical protein